jgi:UDPglucose 6-dehydrogenase
MKIGIVGLGVVGTAIKKGFEFVGHNVIGHDIKLNTDIEDLLSTEIVYICVGTPAREDGSCNLDSVNQVITQLDRLDYSGIIVLKSTVTPGTTDTLIKNYGKRKFAFVPEFLRERCAFDDFVNNHNLLVVGTDDDEIYEKILQSHGNLPLYSRKMTVIESELVKYFSNTYKATKITFANSFHRLATSLGADYTKIKETFILHGVKEGEYLSVNDKFGGYGGMCLPKDIKAIDTLTKELNLDLNIFEFINSENNKFVKKVPKGMRE